MSRVTGTLKPSAFIQSKYPHTFLNQNNVFSLIFFKTCMHISFTQKLIPYTYCLDLRKDSIGTCLRLIWNQGDSNQSEKVPAWEKGSGKDYVVWSAVANHGNSYQDALCAQEDFFRCCNNRLPADVSVATTNKTSAYLKCVWDCFDKKFLG